MDARLRVGEERGRGRCCVRREKRNVDGRAQLGGGRRRGIELA